MCAREVCAEGQMLKRFCVVVEHGADFVHVGKAIVIFGTEGEAFERGKFGHADCVKVPSTGSKKEV
jgi:hypothetical protein